MKNNYLLILFFFISAFVSGQPGTWTWISGTNIYGSAAVYGTQGTPSVNNHPGGLYEACEWKDKQGNFWVYGGYMSAKEYSDLWKYNPVTSEWTWVEGNGLTQQPPSYGTKGVPDPSNTPGARGLAAATFVDTSGNLWLFGGANFNVSGTNDLWQYNISSNNWTWISGDNVPGAAGVYGTQGVPGPSNKPGARFECCSSWNDTLNNLWLFGGFGSLGNFNDLFKYDIAADEWTWMKGSSSVNATVNYGVKGIANVNNDPGSRWTYTKWKDLKDNFWLMGGKINNASVANDVWKYDVGINEWTWMYGSNTPGDSGHYLQKCVSDTVNIPSSRMEQRSAVTDNCGRFWLFGGASNVSLGNLFNDLWVFNPSRSSSGQWEWLSGTNAFNQAGNYGSLGVPSPTNIPPSRYGALAWWGNDNKFYLFGGFGGGFFSDVWVFNPDTNCVASCNSVAVIPPVAGFQASKTTICANDCINFTDLSTNATSWQWTFHGAIDSISTAQNPQGVCYLTTGIYNVTLIASNPGGSDSLTINNYISVNTAPPTPVITQVNDTMLYCSIDTSYRSYQWFLDSALIPGATDTSLVIHTGGNYNVQVANAAGCKIAVGINIILGLQNYMKDNSISVFPNPVNDKLIIDNGQLIIRNIDIYDVLGQVCKESAIRNSQSEINVSELPSGVYFIQLIGENVRWVGRFVKE